MKYVKTTSVFEDACNIIETAQKVAYSTVNLTLVHRNWLLGKRIFEEELEGKRTERYGKEIIVSLSEELTKEYGKGFDKSSLYKFARFYQMHPKIVDSVNPQSGLLSWTHYRVLLQVEDSEARKWHEKEAFEQVWSVRTLQRNISSQYYYRILKTQDKAVVETEMKELTSEYQTKLEFIKNPVIAEFLGMKEDTSYLESDLEQCIIGNLQKFLMELGKGYAFIAR